jgi:hypothetical protein
MYDDNQVKIIKKFPIDQDPPEPWMPGNGPHTAEVYIRFSQLISAVHKGVPKTQQFKDFMRAVHTGVPKTQKHKDNIAAALRKKADK